MHRILLSIVILALSSACSDQGIDTSIDEAAAKPNFQTNVIYGDDDRKDWFEVLDNNVREAARATLGIVDDTLVSIVDDNAVIRTRSSDLCPTENFAEQKKGPLCSGFLVGPDLMLTAAHCIHTEEQCKNFKFVFDYAKESPDRDPAVLPKSSVYSCKKLIARELTREAQDWALVQLDRIVEDRSPLKIERSSEPRLNTPLTIIGHPSGLPSKIARGGKIHQVNEKHFVADLDSFGGNSGSAVLNAETLKVEGILVRGRTDYSFQNGCLTVNICEEGIDTQCKFPGISIEGEHVSKTITLADLIPPLSAEEPEPEEPIVDPKEPSRFLSQTMIPIPDSIFRKVSSDISAVPALNGSNMRVRLVVEHTYISDLRITLVAPNGSRNILHGNTGRRVRNIEGTYGLDIKPYQSLSNLGAQPSGDWSLEIQDRAPLDNGYLIEWEIIPG